MGQLSDYVKILTRCAARRKIAHERRFGAATLFSTSARRHKKLAATQGG
jgi:hypothetical protein